MRDIKDRRSAWLRQRRITMRQFAEATGNYTGTVYTWFRYGRVPRKPYLGSIVSVFPDWPIK